MNLSASRPPIALVTGANKVMAAGSSVVPDQLAAKVAARQTEPGSA